MKIPHPIPYQGSKRSLAKYILRFFPIGINRVIEPFAGSAAISIAAIATRKAQSVHLNDINEPLIELWRCIINKPDILINKYSTIWKKQLDDPRKYYDFIRDEFNRTKLPEYLLYLLARCVKASVRYNAYGNFNQSPDNRRLGRLPDMMSNDIYLVSNLLSRITTFSSYDYRELKLEIRGDDLIYLDPPYQGTCNGEKRYINIIKHYEFIEYINALNKQNANYIISYDGKTGDRNFGEFLPDHLNLHRIEIHAGRSTQATLLGRDECTYESLYISDHLIKQLDYDITTDDMVNMESLQLFGQGVC